MIWQRIESIEESRGSHFSIQNTWPSYYNTNGAKIYDIKGEFQSALDCYYAMLAYTNASASADETCSESVEG